jgi:hypothetical protein
MQEQYSSPVEVVVDGMVLVMLVLVEVVVPVRLLIPII